MNKDLQYTIETIENYSKSMKNKVVSKFITCGFASKKDEEDKIYIKDINESERLIYCINKNNDLVKEIEKWEFEKYYKYSLLYTIPEDVDLVSIIKDKIHQGIVLDYNKIQGNEALRTTAELPSYLVIGQNHFLKFNLKFEAIDNNRVEHRKRYPIVVCFKENSNILEICYDIIEGVYGIDKELYIDMIRTWIADNLFHNLNYFDLTDIIEYSIKNGEDDGVYVVLQNMNLIRGGVATLGVGKNRQNILPFIGDMKAIIENYRSELEITNKSFLNEVDQYFTEIDEWTDYPWVHFKFVKIKVEVKFTRIPDNRGGYILQHYSNQIISNQDRGRMDYVKDYIELVGTRIVGDIEQ